MDPPETITSGPPEAFEIALIRKIESKTKSVRDAFLLLDVDCDGHISPSDLKTALHNECGIDITKEQEDCIFSRSSLMNGFGSSNLKKEIGYSQFAKYFNDVSAATFPASEVGFAAAVGFHQNDITSNGNKKDGNVDRELSIHLTPETIRYQHRRHLRQLLSSHSSRTHGGSGMKETSLFLAIDVHQSGRVTMQEFLDWLKSVGTEWTMDELECVVLGVEKKEATVSERNERQRQKMHWFGNKNGSGLSEEGKEAGMTEHEFAEFMESLDMDCEGGGGNCK